ncbi:hypothetical protein [Ferruginibacter sp.]|nr:hypothetical protein [Ferruginibacter sp.]
MNKKIATILLIGGALFLNACQKSSDIFVPDPGQLNAPDTTWSNTIATSAPVFSLQTNLKIEPLKDSFEVNNTIATILTASGVQVTFSPNCCVSSTGQTVTGKVYAEVLLIKKKGDMVLMNKPTTSNGSMLVSGGEIFIRLMKDGKELQLAPNAKIKITYTDVPVNPNMKLFFGDESNPLQFSWLPNTDTANNSVTAGQQLYEIYTNHLRWINVDYFYDTTGIARSTVSTQLPSNYTNANTSAFLVFKDLRSVLAMHGDVPEKRFITGKVPNGKIATVVAISKQGNDYFMGKELITTGVNVNTANNQKVILSPVKTSLAEIKLFLATL